MFTIVLAAVVVASGIFWATSSPGNAAVGDCLNVKEFKRGNEPDRVGCADPSANVKVAVKLDDGAARCPDGDYDEYSVSGSYKLCLIPNDREGDCLANFSSTTTQGYLHVDCADGKAEVKVVKVAQGVADESGCEGTDATSYRSYSQPKSTYCYLELSQTSI
ncbi:LppU/SCO3897 family protein [Amycolatopsis pigmentata]|uniref:Secreted protein n=1 Tax=Amycolatopsis pigmentata TaxID=450801 RepID=A0ABW5FX24_9PSEU